MSAREIVIRLVFSTVSTVGLSILFYIRPRRLPLATLGGFLTYAVYLLVHTVLASEFVCNMLASLAGAARPPHPRPGDGVYNPLRYPAGAGKRPVPHHEQSGAEPPERCRHLWSQHRHRRAGNCQRHRRRISAGYPLPLPAGASAQPPPPPLKANLNILKSVPGHRSAPVAGRRKALCRLYKSVSESLEE